MLRFIAALLVLLAQGPMAVAGPDEDAVRHLLMTAFDKPESRLSVEPIVVQGDHAVAGWAQGDMGGRALLRRRHGTWSPVLCSGDGIRSAEALRHAGVAPEEAAQLAGRLAEAEKGVAPERLALFAKFEGTLMMDASGGHPQHPPMAQTAQASHGQMPHHASSQIFRLGDIVVEAPYLRATPRGASVAGGYMKISNVGKQPDWLIGGTLEGAGRVEIHEMTMVDNVMRMRQLKDGIEIAPGASVELKPGGLHVMALGLRGSYGEGQIVRGTLTFRNAGSVAAEYRVGPISAGAHQ